MKSSRGGVRRGGGRVGKVVTRDLVKRCGEVTDIQT